MSRATNMEIFKDTERTVRKNKTLLKSVENTIKEQKLYTADSTIVHEKRSVQNAKIIVSGKRTLEAASSYKGKKVCIMNFASATNPGGGVERGSNAQEEALCRISTLYFCLNTPEMRKCFYMPHRKARNPLYNDDGIRVPYFPIPLPYSASRSAYSEGATPKCLRKRIGIRLMLSPVLRLI